MAKQMGAISVSEEDAKKTKNEDALTAFELDALKQLLRGSEPYVEALQAQLGTVSVARREFTRHGFFTSFDTADYKGPIDPDKNFVLGDARAKIAGLELEADLLLFIRDGRVDFLECVSYEPLPDEITSYRLGRI